MLSRKLGAEELCRQCAACRPLHYYRQSHSAYVVRSARETHLHLARPCAMAMGKMLGGRRQVYVRTDMCMWASACGISGPFSYRQWDSWFSSAHFSAQITIIIAWCMEMVHGASYNEPRASTADLGRDADTVSVLMS